MGLAIDLVLQGQSSSLSEVMPSNKTSLLMWGSGSCLLHWQSSFDAIGFSAEKINKSQNNIILTLGNVAAGENSEDTTGFTCVP